MSKKNINLVLVLSPYVFKGFHAKTTYKLATLTDHNPPQTPKKPKKSNFSLFS